MDQTTEAPRTVKRVNIGTTTHLRSSKASTPLTANTLRRRRKGQALVLIALCMVVLLAFVGLAIDGGSMLEQRREAQNGVDGSALAGTRVMLDYYREMIRNNPGSDVDYNHDVELRIRAAIDNYAARNGVLTSTLQAYFVNDDGQLITVNRGVERGPGACGIGQARGYCEVGENGRVPWTLGAKGIDVIGTSQTDSFFMRIVGWDKVSGTASATAYMGVGSMADNISLVPIGLFTSTVDINNIVEGNHYQLIDATLDNGSGNWGWVDYNGQGISATTARAWLVCGFNPSANQLQWATTWCPRYANAPGWAPTRHYIPLSSGPWPAWQADPDDPTYINAIVYGEEHHGWWVRGSSGQVNANCRDFKDRVDEGGPVGVDVLFPIFDRVVGLGGTDSMYHVRVIVAFRLINYGARQDVSCRPEPGPTALPTSTPCTGCPSPTPQPPTSNRTKWKIEGDAIRIYSSSSSGRHGDLRMTSVPVVFLDR
jgi:hypothetical protein